MTDVLLVGASVAGSAVAIHLARMGYSVKLVDRAMFPRRKACGEGLFSPGVAELERLGALPALLPDARVLTSLRFEVAGRRLESPIGTDGRPVIGVQRRLLDSCLLDLAGKSGVDVCLGVGATALLEQDGRYTGVETSAGPMKASVIVAADGGGSRLRREAGLNLPARGRRYGVSAHFRLPEEAEARIEVRFRRDHEVYLTPVGRQVVNVAVLMNRERAASLAGHLRETYLDLVGQTQSLPEGANLLDEPMAAGPFPSRAKRAWQKNLVLVGDAAGFYDGVSGEGMSLALVSARQCAAAVHSFLERGGEEPFAEYDRKRRALARNSQLLGWLTLTLAARPRLAAFAMANLSRRPETFRKLIEINQGERGLTSLRPRDLLALLAGL